MEDKKESKVGFKTHQLIKIPYPAINTDQVASFYVNSLIPVDKIRISIAGDITSTVMQAGVLVYSNLVNNYIGTIGTKYTIAAGGLLYFEDILSPANGITYFYPNKVQLTGQYNLRFVDFEGNPTANINLNGLDSIYLLIEYFQE